ncbi:hypothetical protein [Brucella sp. IR073]|uniref:hypothetical protein n=1 Tax=unclassified Brucella TaxID=2632610 RepID=UPI003B980E6D
MPKFFYALEYGLIYRYVMQSDGSLSTLGEPVSCINAVDIAYSNASRFAGGDNYLFVISTTPAGAEACQGISVYHVENDGSLTERVTYYCDGVGSSPQDIIALWWYGTDSYFVYIVNRGVTGSEISGYRFSESGSIEFLGDPLTPLPADLAIDTISLFEIVAEDGAGGHPSRPVPCVYALYTTPCGKTKIASFEIDESGFLNYAGSSISSDGIGIALAATPQGDFSYITHSNINSIAGSTVGAGRFQPLGPVAQMTSHGPCVACPEGKYLFVSAIADHSYVIISYRIGADGLLVQSDQKPCGAGIWTLGIEPDGQYLYAPSSDGLVYIYQINRNDGTLVPKPPSPRSNGGNVCGMAILDV